jgi:hypothetical protein
VTGVQTCALPISESVNRSQMEVCKIMDLIGFLCVSLGSSIVQLHDSLRTRRSCAYSEAGISSQNGGCA